MNEMIIVFLVKVQMRRDFYVKRQTACNPAQRLFLKLQRLLRT